MANPNYAETALDCLQSGIENLHRVIDEYGALQTTGDADTPIYTLDSALDYLHAAERKLEEQEVPPLVVVVRDPAFSNEYAVFGGDVETHDIDCGSMDLNDPDEYKAWAESHLETASALEKNYPEAATYIRLVVRNYEPNR